MFCTHCGANLEGMEPFEGFVICPVCEEEVEVEDNG